MTKFTKNEISILNAHGFTVGRQTASKEINGGMVVIGKVITGGYTRQTVEVAENGNRKIHPYQRFEKFRQALNG